MRRLTRRSSSSVIWQKHQPSVVPHPPYSPDLAPTDVFLFPKLKTTLKGRRFQITEEIQKNTIRELRAVTESAFQ